MNLAQHLSSAWQALEAGSFGEYLDRKVDDLGVANAAVRLGRDSKGAWELLIRVTSTEKFKKNLSVRGVEVFFRTIGAHPLPEKMLVLRCVGEPYRSVFSQFAATVLEETSGAQEPAHRAIDILSAWQEVFGRVMRPKEQLLKGVFAELSELILLLSEHGVVDAEIWRGPHAEPQDFRRGSVALEIKSVRSWSAGVRINGLAQLDARPYSELALGALKTLPDEGGETVGELAHRAISLGFPSETIWDGLAQLELSRDDVIDQGGPKFVVQERRYFRVTPVSPVFTEANLSGAVPNSVTEITYLLDLSQLSELSPVEVASLRKALAGK